MPIPLATSFSTSAVDHLARARHLLAQGVTELERSTAVILAMDEVEAVKLAKAAMLVRESIEMLGRVVQVHEP